MEDTLWNKIKPYALAGLLALAGIVAILIAHLDPAVPGPGPSPTPLPSPTISASPSPSPVPLPSATVTPSPSPSPSPKPSPSPSPAASPSPSPTAPSGPTSGSALVLATRERPEFAKPEQWKASALRTVLRGASTGFILKDPDPCSLVGTPNLNAMGVVTTIHPSFEGARVGRYSTVVVPLSSGNCGQTDHLWLEFPSVLADRTVTIHGVSVTVKVHARALPPTPAVPLLAELSQAYLQFGHFGGYGGQEALLAKIHGDVLQAHRITAIKSWVTFPSQAGTLTDNGPIGFKTVVTDRSLGSFVSLPNQPNVNLASAESLAQSLLGRPFFYTQDEPGAADLTSSSSNLYKLLAAQKAGAPSVLRMVTTSRDPSYPVDPLIDVYAPVVNNFDNSYDGRTYPGPAAYAGKKVWLYPSCMSNGCTGCTGAVEGRTCYVAGKDNMVPDLALDRPASHAFALFGMALRYRPTVGGLLYYSVVELEWLDSRPFLNPWAFGANLDGQLQFALRPGEMGVLVHSAAPSIVMKELREASHFADVMELLRQQDPVWVADMMSALVSKTTVWNRDVAAWELVLDQALQKLQ